MSRIRRALVLFAIALTGCLSGETPHPRAASDISPVRSAAAPLDPPPPLPLLDDTRLSPPLAKPLDDRLQPGVVIGITVTNEETLSLKSVRIGPDGKLFFPFLGRIDAVGLSPLEFAETISTQLQERGYVRAPQVNVEVLEESGRQAYVLGRVGKPGAYDLPFDRGLTLTQLIARAGGLATNKSDLEADPSAIRLIRTVDGERRTYRISFLDIVDRGQIGADVTIQDGDLIYVPPKQELYIFGSVNRPGGFPLADGSRLGIAEVLALAGGFTERADPEGILLIRRGARGAKTYLVPADAVRRAEVEVTTNDTIIVPAREVRRVFVIGSVARQGGIPLDAPDLTVTKIIVLAGGMTRLAAKNSVQLIRRGKIYTIPVKDILASGDIKRDPLVEPGDTIWVPEAIF